MYSANKNQADFIECHLEDGRISCSFSAGGGILKLTSIHANYTDGNWHTVSGFCYVPQFFVIMVLVDLTLLYISYCNLFQNLFGNGYFEERLFANLTTKTKQ